MQHPHELLSQLMGEVRQQLERARSEVHTQSANQISCLEQLISQIRRVIEQLPSKNKDDETEELLTRSLSALEAMLDSLSKRMNSIEASIESMKSLIEKLTATKDQSFETQTMQLFQQFESRLAILERQSEERNLAMDEIASLKATLKAEHSWFEQLKTRLETSISESKKLLEQQLMQLTTASNQFEKDDNRISSAETRISQLQAQASSLTASLEKLEQLIECSIRLLEPRLKSQKQ